MEDGRYGVNDYNYCYLRMLRGIVALAAALAKKKDVLVVSTGNNVPALPVYLPSEPNLGTNQSLGGLLDTPGGISEARFKRPRYISIPKTTGFIFSGFVSSELPGISIQTHITGCVEGAPAGLESDTVCLCDYRL